jgi:hypothetical protein
MPDSANSCEVPKSETPDFNTIKEEISAGQLNFKTLPFEYRDNFKIVEAAVKKNPLNYEYVSNRLRDNDHIAKIAF